MEKNIEKFSLVGGNKCKEVLAAYPTYRVFWRSGFEYRGAGEHEIKREGERKIFQPGGWTIGTFEEEMQRKYNWSAAIDIEIDHEKKEIHMNGFSENEMW